MKRLRRQCQLCCKGVKEQSLIYNREDNCKKRECQVFRHLQQYSLRVKLSKCRFFQDELEFLGHTISWEGVRLTKERVDNILSAKSKKQDGAQVIHRLDNLQCEIPTRVLHPLYSLLRKNARWSWGKKRKYAFKKAKELVRKPPVLAHYSVNSAVKL